MKDTLKAFLVGLGLLVGVVGLAFGVPYLRLQVLRLYGTELESVKTDIYRENKSYVEGTVRDLREMRVEYERAGDGHRDALRSLIKQRAGELDWSRLPEDVRSFLEGLE